MTQEPGPNDGDFPWPSHDQTQKFWISRSNDIIDLWVTGTPFITLSTALKFRPKFFWKQSFFDQKQQLLNNVEPFERILRALLIAQCPYKFSSFLDHRTGSSRFRLFARDFRLFGFFFRDLHAFRNWPSPEFEKLSKKISWRIWKVWKKNSVDQIHCGGESSKTFWKFITCHKYGDSRENCGNLTSRKFCEKWWPKKKGHADAVRSTGGC